MKELFKVVKGLIIYLKQKYKKEYFLQCVLRVRKNIINGDLSETHQRLSCLIRDPLETSTSFIKDRQA